MSFLFLNVAGLVTGVMLAIFCGLRLIARRSRNPAVILALSLFTLWPAFMAWHCFTGLVHGDRFEDETARFLKVQLEGHAGASPAMLALAGTRAAEGYQLDKIDVQSIWQSEVRLNDSALPYNLYEVHTLWRSRALGHKEEACFFYGYANDRKQGYRRHTQLFPGCADADAVIMSLKRSEKFA